MSDPRLDLMERLGVDAVPHNSNDGLLSHLRATSELLRSWGARDALCDAGLFHSIYGTEYFPTTTLEPERREEVRAVIGAEAEELVWLWCFGRRDTLRPSFEGTTAPRIEDRRDGSWIELDDRQLTDLLDLWIADTLEQLPRVAHREVPTAQRLTAWSARALPAAREALDATVAQYAG